MHNGTQLLAIFGSLLVSLAVDARTIQWRALDVSARLESSGELSIAERHTMVFDGDWNGGERVFRVEPAQRLIFKSISRIDEDGSRVQLAQRNPPSRIDDYMLADGKQLRWRVRAPADPPLRNREITYVIEYALRNVLSREGENYRLDHNFAFDRPGAIERYTLRLNLDSAWRVIPETAPLMFEKTNVAPKESVRGTFVLDYVPEGQPQFVFVPGIAVAQRAADVAADPAPRPLPKSRIGWMLNLIAVSVFFIIAGLTLRSFLQRERALGRFETVEPNRAWLSREILSQRPEVLGTAWDATTSEAEVAALIALMTIEGKIAQSREKDEPVLTLLVPRASLSDYEREFVDKLFVKGDRIDPSTLRSHYKSTGFNPSTPLKLPLAKESERLVGRRPILFACLTAVIGAFVFFNVLPVVGVMAGDPLSAASGLIGAVAMPLSIIFAGLYRTRLQGPRMARAIVVPPAILAIAGIFAASPFVAFAFAFVAMLIVWVGFSVAQWNGTAEQLRNYRNVRAARRFFQRILERREPIEEHWVPYILAFGLGNEFDQWSVATPRQDHDRRSTTNAVPSTSGPSSSSPRFVEGGGAFGGAGATGGWAAGISTFAAGVASPSSSGGGSSSGFSSGGSSGGGGGSRSGGGSGGGW